MEGLSAATSDINGCCSVVVELLKGIPLVNNNLFKDVHFVIYFSVCSKYYAVRVVTSRRNRMIFEV